MTELNSYSNNKNLKTVHAEIQSTPKSIVEYSEHLPGLVHYPRLDSKTILQNMEEVLDSVKKQHKEKHRRKKELKKLAMIEAANGSEMVRSTDGVSKDKRREHSDKKHKHRDKDRRRSKKKPLQETSTAENDQTIQESPVKSGSISQHLIRTPKKERERVINESNEIEEKAEDNVENIKKVTNAFEVMMNARNKSIGSNTPGKDYPSPVADNELPGANAKRKLKLQEWAERKGSSKRKLDEEARAAYVDEQMDQRAKRFKKMLVSGAASPKNSSSTISKTERKTKTDKNKLKENNEKNKLKSRKEPKARRLNSIDSVDSLEELSPTKLDTETSEFLAKLNSPTKKRDSLLGYFHKKESHNEEATKVTSRKSKKRKDTKSNIPTVDDNTVSCEQNTPDVGSNQPQGCIEDEIGTPSGRPRRSCAGKARYDYDLERSPMKNTRLGRKTDVRKTKPRCVIAPQEPELVDTIILDDSTNMSSCDTATPNATPKKLAPLFVRSLPKPSPDPEILKARKAFLQSGVPDKLRLEQEKQKQYDQNFEETAEIFPKISHVKQLNENELKYDKEIVRYPLKIKSEACMLLSPSPTRKSKATARSNKRQPIVAALPITHDMQLQKKSSQHFSLDQISLPSIANKREIIKSWKIEFDRFPTFKCYNQMREKYRYFSAIDSAQDTEQVSESFVVTRQNRRPFEVQNKRETDSPDEEYKPPATAPNGELLFSEKYKPLLFEQVLVNLNPVTQLKEFLSNWSNNGNGSGRNSQNLEDSMDLNDSTSSNQGPSCNTVVLLGPVSSGKTSAVFALANEMNFNVLEINAGMKRTGKRLIQELQEATQSHQIRKDSAGSGSSQKHLLKMSISSLKSKLKKQNSNSNQIDSQNVDSSILDPQHQSARKCLILIEDADIVFEQTDAGFTDSIYSLASSSKRPVIVVASNPNCAHLQRLILQNTIHFFSPNVLNISKFLAVLSLIENCPVQLDDIVSLYLYNHRDLRKTILELQFFIQSGGDRHRQVQFEEEIKANEEESPNYFASPRKRQFSVEQQESETSDNNIPAERNNAVAKFSDTVYMHRTLFEYYTVGQNSKWRIPYPVDFHLLNSNLNEIFKVSRKLREDSIPKSCENATTHTMSKRKSKSPKKQWLTTARANLKSPLDNLCSFYENLSIAALVGEQYNMLDYYNKPKRSISDRLKPIVSETISHCLLEKSIEVNLDAELCPYNLFDTPKNSVSLCQELGSMQLRSCRARSLDYEPSLRSICRSEKIRSTLERRSTRFYHYLRNYSINVSNFSTVYFDQACEVLQISNAEENQTTNATTASVKPI